VIGAPPVLDGGLQRTNAPVSVATACTAVGALGALSAASWIVNQWCGRPIALCSAKPVVAIRRVAPEPSTPST